jgi:hypothetical protein
MDRVEGKAEGTTAQGRNLEVRSASITTYEKHKQFHK